MAPNKDYSADRRNESATDQWEQCKQTTDPHRPNVVPLRTVQTGYKAPVKLIKHFNEIYLKEYFDFSYSVSWWSNRPNISQNLLSNILFEICDQKVPVQLLRRCGERTKTQLLKQGHMFIEEFVGWSSRSISSHNN